MVSRSWFLHSDESGFGRPSIVTEPVRRAVEDDFAFSAAELLETALNLTLARPGVTRKGQ
ncbi:hypothetical protein ACIHAR_24860 [Streptomyces sp. NPDC052016]|uniref:hypothetical protein n=1 Tax=Streptomyces TaxID=1883 RepID=UPI003414797F